MFPIMAAAAMANQDSQMNPQGGSPGGMMMMPQGGGDISKSIKYILIAIAVALGGFFGWRAYKNYQDKKKATENNNLDTSITPQMVLDNKSNKGGLTKLTDSQLDSFYKSYGKMFSAQLRAAFNPSGFSWLISTDTTNNKEVMAIADKMKELGIPFKYVAGAYYEAYQDDLNLRLQKELNTKELKEFYTRSGLQGLGITAQIYSSMPISGFARI